MPAQPNSHIDTALLPSATVTCAALIGDIVGGRCASNVALRATRPRREGAPVRKTMLAVVAVVSDAPEVARCGKRKDVSLGWYLAVAF